MPDDPKTKAQQPQPLPSAYADVWGWMENAEELLRDPEQHGMITMTLDPTTMEAFIASQIGTIEQTPEHVALGIALLMRGRALQEWMKAPDKQSVRDVRIKLIRGLATQAHLYARVAKVLASMGPVDFAEGLDNG